MQFVLYLVTHFNFSQSLHQGSFFRRQNTEGLTLVGLWKEPPSLA
jgi:hypothetical protein